MSKIALRPGQIFRLFLRYIDPPKPKFLVLAYVADDGRARLFAINSEPTEFQKQNDELAEHQINMPQASYPAFLRHDSVLCCSELLGGWTAAELEDVLIHQPERLVGHLLEPEVEAARAVIQDSRLLSEREKERILAQLKP